jgi:chromosome segregation ATPase
VDSIGLGHEVNAARRRVLSEINAAPIRDAVAIAEESPVLSPGEVERIRAAVDKKVSERVGQFRERYQAQLTATTQKVQALVEEVEPLAGEVRSLIEAANAGQMTAAQLHSELKNIDRRRKKALSGLRTAESTLPGLIEKVEDPQQGYFELERRNPLITLRLVGGQPRVGPN